MSWLLSMQQKISLQHFKDNEIFKQAMNKKEKVLKKEQETSHKKVMTNSLTGHKSQTNCK